MVKTYAQLLTINYPLLVLIKLFSLGVTAESLRSKRDRKSAMSLQHSHFDPKFRVEGVALHQPFFFSEN